MLGGSRKHIFAHLTKAVKLIALVQASSEFIERLFSQDKLVLNEVLQDSLIDNFETSVMMRLNKYFNNYA